MMNKEHLLVVYWQLVFNNNLILCWLHVENPSTVAKSKDTSFTHYLPISYTTTLWNTDSVFASGSGWGNVSRVFTSPYGLTAIVLGITTTSGGSLSAGGAAGGVITIGY